MPNPTTPSKNIFAKIKALFVKPQPEKTPDWNARVAERAHELYEQRGGQEGQADQDWYQAEEELKGKLHD